MESDPHRQLPGDEDPLDTALGELSDLAELERSFAELDARLGRGVSEQRSGSEDDPFSDIAAALREHRAASDASDGDVLTPIDRDHGDQDDDSDSVSVADALDGVDLEAAERAQEIEQLCQDALDALEADDLELAREIALGGVRLDDEHPFPMFVLGLVAERQGDLDTARDMAELALRSAETNPDAIGLRAHIHVAQHEFDQAAALLRFGITHNPDEAMLHEGLARVALAQGRTEEALKSASTALRLEPSNPGAMAVRAAALEASADRSSMLAALRQGVLLHPEDPYGMVELASLEMEHGNLDRARSLLMRASRLAPHDRHIGDVRVLVDHVHERRLLRPVPALLRWLRDFPGGLPGFLVGLLVAALPVHALAVAMPQYRIPAAIVLGAWGLVALYAWIAPSVLTHRLNQRAAAGSRSRVELELLDPLAPPPPTEQVAEALAMLVDARERRAAATLAMQVMDRLPDDDGAVDGLRDAIRTLTSVRVRAGLAWFTSPPVARILVAVGAIALLCAPTFEDSGALTRTAWYAISTGALLLAWLLTTVERRVSRALDEVFAEIRLLGSARPPLGPLRRRHGA